jgi:hypothetical protein
MYGIRITRKAKGSDVPDVKAVFTYQTKAGVDAQVKHINKYSYADETTEVLKAAITWDVIETTNGELERG